MLVVGVGCDKFQSAPILGIFWGSGEFYKVSGALAQLVLLLVQCVSIQFQALQGLISQNKEYKVL
jgi:hypothetical protein